MNDVVVVEVVKTFRDSESEILHSVFLQLSSLPVFVNVVDQVTTFLERCRDVYIPVSLEGLNESHDVWVSALGHHSCFVVVLGAIALLQLLFVDHFHSRFGSSNLVFRKFNRTDWSRLEGLCSELVLVNLVFEALGLQELVYAAHLILFVVKVDLTAAFDCRIVV